MKNILSDLQHRVWDLIGAKNVYDKNITNTKNRIVRKFIEAEGHYVDLVLSQQKDPVVLVEVGCGTGRLLIKYIQQALKTHDTRKGKPILRDCKNNIAYVIGFDYSTKMIERLKENLAKKSINRSDQHFKILTADARAMEGFLPKLITERKLGNLKKVFLCMLCTIGNMEYDVRAQFYEQLNKVSKNGDVLIISSWNRNFFSKGIREIYPKFKDVVGEFSDKNIDKERATLITESNYYIHWFDIEELTKEVSLAGFKVTDKFPRKDNYFFILKAVRDSI